MNVTSIILGILGGVVVFLIFKIAELVNRISMLEYNSGTMISILKKMQDGEKVNIIFKDETE